MLAHGQAVTKKNVDTWRRIKYTNIIIQFLPEEKLDNDIYRERVLICKVYDEKKLGSCAICVDHHLASINNGQNQKS
jgi:hypothetical protein